MINKQGEKHTQPGKEEAHQGENQGEKLTPRALKKEEIFMLMVAAIYCLITFILFEMSHPLGPIMMVGGLIILGIIIWVHRPKEQWEQMKARIKEVEKQQAQTPFGKVKKVVEAIIAIVTVVVVIVIVVIWLLEKFK